MADCFLKILINVLFGQTMRRILKNRHKIIRRRLVFHPLVIQFCVEFLKRDRRRTNETQPSQINDALVKKIRYEKCISAQ